MKVVLIILFALALEAGYSVSAHPSEAKQAGIAQNQTDPNAVTISVSDNRIHVENAPADSKMEIYSVVGIKVKEIQMKQSSGDYIVDIAKGYYIIRIGDTVRKIAIR